jgi:CBS domain-containing protein
MAGAEPLTPFPRIGDLWLQPVLALGPETKLWEAAHAMRTRDVSAAVIGVPGVPLAVVTERDLTRATAERRGPDDDVATIATERPLTVDRATSVVDAAAIMLRHGLRHLVVADEHKLEGMVSMRDVLSALVVATTADSVVVRLNRSTVQAVSN